MAFPQGINFRATSGYISGETANCDYEVSTTSNYPRTTAQGNNVGWEGTPTANDTRDRSTTPDHRLSGLVFNTASGNLTTYRIDLPSASHYNIRCACGDYSNPGITLLEIFDDVTSLGVIVTGVTGSGNFRDATNTEYSAANWPGSNTAIQLTFASTICRLRLGNSTTPLYVMAHFYIESAENPGVPVAWLKA